MDNYKMATFIKKMVGGGIISQNVPFLFIFDDPFWSLRPRTHLMQSVKNPESRRHEHHHECVFISTYFEGSILQWAEHIDFHRLPVYPVLL